jgi:hypothetical protein
MIKRYILNILIWLDIGLNVLLWAGSPHETISSHAGKAADAGNPVACRFCALLAAILGPQHCQNSEVPDFGETITGKGTKWLMIFGGVVFALMLAWLWAFSEGAVILDFSRWL